MRGLYPRTREPVWTRYEPARARSRADCGNSRRGSMASILSKGTDSGGVTRSDAMSASRFLTYTPAPEPAARWAWAT